MFDKRLAKGPILGGRRGRSRFVPIHLHQSRPILKQLGYRTLYVTGHVTLVKSVVSMSPRLEKRLYERLKRLHARRDRLVGPQIRFSNFRAQPPNRSAIHALVGGLSCGHMDDCIVAKMTVPRLISRGCAIFAIGDYQVAHV